MINDIKNSVNIVDVIGEVVSLSRAGRNYLGLCPFHKEKTPSFNVIEDRQFFHCFGCGRSGDVFKFLEDYRNISFLESVQVLADRAGINITVQDKSQETRQEHPNQRFFNINDAASKFYQAILKTTKIGETARQYLYDRGLTDELIDYFKIGLAPDEHDYLYQAMLKKYDEDTIINSGLFNLSDSNTVYDAFRNRIMFPLTDEFGHIVGFSGRIWTEADSAKKQAKYKNTRATAVFNKSYELYHLDRAKATAKKEHEIYLMEGFMDVIAAYRCGISNAVASMGTALTPEHVKHLQKFTKKVILTYDGDSAGQKAIAKSLDILSDMAVEIVRIPGQMDPDEFIKENSAEELKKLLTQARISSVEFWLHHLKPENIDNLQAEIDYVEKMAKIIAASPSITAQNTYINMVAEGLPDFNYQQVEQAVNNERLQTRSQRSEQALSQPIRAELPMSKHLSAVAKAESQLFHRILHHGYLLNEFRNRDDFKFETPELQELYQLLKTNGELNAYDLSQLPEKLQNAYYRVLEENLPEEIAEGEIKQLESRRNKYLQQQEMRKQSKTIRENSNHGDIDTAVEGLAALIAQKRNME
ncbi:DNA primase [Streptococcus ratti]|uniref:DNA primase n=1 Tax=Streptococcus ratti FA-1 = DSM 20564 TaxID=699248 RepID=A0ABP2QZD7_STRRT|nr:DNA primase [Streptococcus ratti]EJN93677.1 DNA primase [Streptococcus ratti FA-1 = DSM 20564]EMP71238.1 DNA primase [Streptococcus ratti FA-1 = DSM 20564]VEI59989.1 DNA primase [Streptococcus mutans]